MEALRTLTHFHWGRDVSWIIYRHIWIINDMRINNYLATAQFSQVWPHVVSDEEINGDQAEDARFPYATFVIVVTLPNNKQLVKNIGIQKSSDIERMRNEHDWPKHNPVSEGGCLQQRLTMVTPPPPPVGMLVCTWGSGYYNKMSNISVFELRINLLLLLLLSSNIYMLFNMSSKAWLAAGKQ